MEENKTVEVVEKHVHKDGSSGVANAGLITGSIGTAGVLGLGLVEIAKALSNGWANRSNAGNVATMVASAIPAVANAFAGPRVAYDVPPMHHCMSRELAQKDATIARLEAERYSDNAALTQSDRLLQNYLKPYGEAIAASQVNEARMQAEIDCLKKTQALELEIVRKDVQLARQEAECCCKQNAAAINTLAVTLGAITKTVVPSTAVCTAPTTPAA